MTEFNCGNCNAGGYLSNGIFVCLISPSYSDDDDDEFSLFIKTSEPEHCSKWEHK